MKLVAIPALLRFSVPDDTPIEAIEDIAQALVSDTNPTAECIGGTLTDQVQDQAKAFIKTLSSKPHVQQIQDVNVWVNEGEIQIHDI